MRRLLSVSTRLAPSAASASQRLGQLVVLWSLTAATSGITQDQLVTGFALVGTFVMICDSGAGYYMLARKPEELTRSVFARACGVHLSMSLLGLVVCAGFLGIVLQRPVAGSTVLVLVALGFTQLQDSLSRVVRFPLLNRGHDLQYSWPELTMSVGKIALAGWVGTTGHLLGLLAMPLLSVVVLLAAVRPVRAALLPSTGHPPTVREILTYGLAGAINATYSQLPLIVASLILTNAGAAVLATLMRIFQALEIVPGTLALQAIPRYAHGRRGIGRDWLTMTGGSAALGLVCLPLLPLAGRVLDLDLQVGLGALLALAFVARCGGYLLSSYLMGTGRIDVRLRLTATAAVVMAPVIPALVVLFHRPGAAVACAVAELLLAGLFARRISRDPAAAVVEETRLETADVEPARR